MQKTYQETHLFIEQYGSALSKLTTKREQIVIAPSFVALPLFSSLIKNSSVALCAQDCSAYPLGAYTGQVDAQSLKQVGCSYCLVGHSERRHYCQENDELIAQKVKQLLTVGICPVVCVGETQQEYDAGVTQDIIRTQLNQVLQLVRSWSEPVSFCIAYEPRFAIGTGIVPTPEHLNMVFDLLIELTEDLKKHSVRLLYGGSVSESTIAMLCQIKHLHGFLIGNASLDFQNFEKIVSLSQKY